MYDPSKMLFSKSSVLTLLSVYIFLQYTSHSDPTISKITFQEPSPIFHFLKVIFNFIHSSYCTISLFTIFSDFCDGLCGSCLQTPASIRKLAFVPSTHQGGYGFVFASFIS